MDIKHIEFEHQMRRLGKAIIFVSISGLFAGCVYDPVYYGPPAYPDYHPHYYDYYYYPSVGVYFHFTTGYYYYRDHTHWVRARVLPPHIHLDVHNRVKIHVKSDKPYVKYPEHKRIYTPKPDYKYDEKRSKREREANRLWYQQYEREQYRHEHREKKRDKNNGRGKDEEWDKGKKRRD